MRFSLPIKSFVTRTAIHTATGLLLSTIALSLIPLKAEARSRVIPQSNSLNASNVVNPSALRRFQTPSVKPAAGVEPTCYVKMAGGPVQFLDHLCGVNDFKPDRRRDPNELDKDGISFLMKENFQAIKDLQNKLGAAQQRLESEMPVSNAAKQLMAEQKALFNGYASIKTEADGKAFQQRLEANQKKIQQDPTIKKSHEMMRKLYQQRN